MVIRHKKNTLYYLALPMVDSATPAQFKTGLTVADEAYYKDGAGAWTALSITDTFAEIGTSCIYAITLTAAELNHDRVIIKLTATGAADSFIMFEMDSIEIDDIPTTPMRGTDSAALASICTEARLAELDQANLPADVAAIPTTAMRGTDGANTTVPDAAGVAAALHGMTDELINALNNPSTAQIVTGIFGRTGITQGGTWDFTKAIKILMAWTMGKWRDKPGVSGTYQILDPDDGSTVIAEITPSETSPQKISSIKI